MKLLDKLTKWFFYNEPKEKNVDWRLVALDLNRDNDELRNQMKELIQENADLRKFLKMYEEKEK
jgi:hypothetical protein